MLLEHGVSYAIVGHSEPRKYFSESDEQINKRAVFAQSRGLGDVYKRQILLGLTEPPY